eukprot:7332925-Pyramimonas_sp.AAC.1
MTFVPNSVGPRVPFVSTSKKIRTQVRRSSIVPERPPMHSKFFLGKSEARARGGRHGEVVVGHGKLEGLGE